MAADRENVELLDELEEERAGNKEGKQILKEVVKYGLRGIRDGLTEELRGSLKAESVEELQNLILGESRVLLSGVVYMTTHSDTWLLVANPIKIAMFISSLSLLFLIAVAYPGQAYFLEKLQISSIVAHLISFGLIIVESFVLIFLIITPSVYGSLMKRLFIFVYNENCSDDLKIKPSSMSVGICCRSLGSILLRALIHVATVWLHFIPYFGTYAYIRLNARFYTWELFSVYFEQKGIYSIKTQFQLVKKLQLQKPFGAEAVGLKSLPIAGMFFALSNTVAAALYAAEELDTLAANKDGEKDILHV